MSPPLYMSTLLVLLVLVCYGSALRVSSYRCSRPLTGLDDPACSLIGDVFTCATNGSVVPYLSDGDVSMHIWQGSSYLDLDIPNSVCLEAIVMTFNKQTTFINLPTFTTEQSTNFTTTYPAPGTDGVGNTTITFTQQYCQPSVRINMTQPDPAHFIILLEVFLIQPVDPTGTTDGSTPPPSPAATTSSSQGPPMSSPGATSTPADLTLPLVTGVVVAGVVIIILLVIVVVIVGVLCVLKASPPSDTKDSVIYDHVDQDPYSHVKMDKNPVYETTGTAVVLDKNPAYEKAGVEDTYI